MIEKVRLMEQRYNELSNKLSEPGIADDQKLFTDLMKEFKNLTPVVEKYREYDRFIKCSKCELKAWCRGCPAVANGTNGDFYRADPQCWKMKNERTGERLSC